MNHSCCAAVVIIMIIILMTIITTTTIILIPKVIITTTIIINTTNNTCCRIGLRETAAGYGPPNCSDSSAEPTFGSHSRSGPRRKDASLCEPPLPGCIIVSHVTRHTSHVTRHTSRAVDLTLGGKAGASAGTPTSAKCCTRCSEKSSINDVISGSSTAIQSWGHM